MTLEWRAQRTQVNEKRRFTADLQQIYNRFTTDLQQIYSSFTADLQHIYNRFTTDLSQISQCHHPPNFAAFLNILVTTTGRLITKVARFIEPGDKIMVWIESEEYFKRPEE